MVSRRYVAALAMSSALASSIAAPAYAQKSAAVSDQPSDIIVTARRVEERLQDVPISITVFNQQQISNKNITSATDLASFTPSLQANNNFGEDNTTFAIRGFVQDIGTQPSVGTYFGDVVALRGASNGQPVGDGASAGDFFDLSNVQVLKGPQGTLFGRNTTGGAVLFVPQKPTSRTEGYVEGSIGNYDMRRVQAVLNVPVADTFRVRLGLDRMTRDGYLHNISGIGPRDFEDTDYWAGRLSVVADLTPNLENYVIASFSRSRTNGALNKLVAADATQTFGALSVAQLNRQGNDFYNVENPLAAAGLKTEQWQIIDTTTWRSTDTLTVKNIASYGELKQSGSSPIFGVRWLVPAGGTVYNTDFEESVAPPGLDTAHESTFTEEFRLEGSTNDSRLTYQAGAYLEIARPLSDVGSQSPGFASCVGNGNGNNFQCTDPYRLFFAEQAAARFGIPAAFILPSVPPIGNINYTVGRTSFHDIGLYGQATYKVSDKLKFTGGFRYTWDHELINSVQKVYLLATPPAYGTTGYTCENATVATLPSCNTRYYTKSSKPTWLIDLDYTPTPNVLVYAKYARGYRAATIAPNIPEAGTAANPDTTLNYIKPEKVDTFEVGTKTAFHGAVRGTFNVAAFYNNFTNQQIQVGFLPLSSSYPQTAAPVNAGKSKIYGAEVEATATFLHNLDFSLSYTYLRTRIDEVVALPSNPAYSTVAAFNVGDPLALSPRHKVVFGGTYTLPLGPSVGRIAVGGTLTYRSSLLSNYTDRANPNPAIAALSYIPSLTLVSLDLNWRDIAGRPIDLGIFVTNATNKRYYIYTGGLGATQLGFEDATVGEPRMYGARLRVRFGR